MVEERRQKVPEWLWGVIYGLASTGRTTTGQATNPREVQQRSRGRLRGRTKEGAREAASVLAHSLALLALLACAGSRQPSSPGNERIGWA